MTPIKKSNHSVTKYKSKFQVKYLIKILYTYIKWHTVDTTKSKLFNSSYEKVCSIIKRNCISMVERRVLMFQAKQRTGAQLECLSSRKVGRNIVKPNFSSKVSCKANLLFSLASLSVVPLPMASQIRYSLHVWTNFCQDENHRQYYHFTFI